MRRGAPQQPGKENVDELSDKKVGSLGVDENEKAKMTQESSIKSNQTQDVLPSQRPNDVTMQPSELVKTCNNVCTNYAQEMSQIRDWCETALQEIHDSKGKHWKKRKWNWLCCYGCFESFDPNAYSEIEKMHADLRLLAEAMPHLSE